MVLLFVSFQRPRIESTLKNGIYLESMWIRGAVPSVPATPGTIGVNSAKGIHTYVRSILEVPNFVFETYYPAAII